MLTRRNFVLGSLGTGLVLTTQGSHSVLAQKAASGRRLIVDSQVHMWKANTPDRPWAAGRTAQLPEPMTIERLVPMMDEAGVDRVLNVPPRLEGKRIDYGQEAARRYPGRFATMGSIDLNDPGEAGRIATWRQQPAVLGIRINISGETAKALAEGKLDWLWPAAQQAGVPIMFLTTGQTGSFATIAERHPRLDLIVDHMGISSATVRAGNVPAAVAATASLAKYPNVGVKVSASPLFSKQPYPWPDVTPHIQRLFEAYGPRRCYWGTDMTNSFAKATYRQRITHFTETLPFLTEDDKDWIMGRALLQKLRWA